MRAVNGTELTEKDNVAEAIERLLHEVQAARRDLRVTGFCLEQSEAIRRIDRAKASLDDLMQPGKPPADVGLPKLKMRRVLNSQQPADHPFITVLSQLAVTHCVLDW